MSYLKIKLDNLNELESRGFGIKELRTLINMLNEIGLENNQDFDETRKIFFDDLENYEEVIRMNDGKIEIPDNFLLDAFGSSVHTARGIILVRTEGTYLSGVLLGTFDPKLILHQMKAKPATQE